MFTRKCPKCKGSSMGMFYSQCNCDHGNISTIKSKNTLKCPACKYTYGYIIHDKYDSDGILEKENKKTIIGNEDFSYLEGKFKKIDDYKNSQFIKMTICPKCNNLFINKK